MRRMILILLLAAFAVLLRADSPAVQPWSAGLNRAGRFRPNTSGRMSVEYDREAKAVRCSAERNGAADFWVYPQIDLKASESFAHAGKLRFEIQADAATVRDGINCAFVQISPGAEIPFPVPGTEWRTVEVDLSGRTLDKAKVLRIGINPKGDRAVFRLRNIQVEVPAAFAAKIAASPVPVASAVEAAAPGTVFHAGQPVELRLKEGVCLPETYEITSIDGETVASGSWPESGALTLPNPGIGYYALTLAGNGVDWQGRRTFAVVADPASYRRNPQSFFSVDSAQSWLAAPDYTGPLLSGDAYETVSELCRLGGFGSVRERISWGQCEPRPGEYAWGKYAVNAKLLAERGIGIASTFHDAPARTRTVSRKLPDDLLALYRFSEALAREFEGKIGAWEFWNEPDGGFASESAWDFAAAQKAAYLGFKAGAPSVKVMQGGFCLHPLIPYYQTFFDNDAAGYFDILSFHTYRPVANYPVMVRDIRDMLARNGAAGKPLWFTESGTDSEGNGEEASPVPGLRAHSPQQELMVAEFIPKSALTLQAAGVDRNFFFVLPPVNERGGAKVWGLLRRDYTVEPGFLAIAALNRVLGNAVCLGSLDPAPSVRGVLYRRPDGEKTLAFWAVSPRDGEAKAATPPGTISIPVRSGSCTVTDIWGRSKQQESRDGRLELPVSAMTAYVTGDLALEPSVPVPPKGESSAAFAERELAVVLKADLSNDFRLLPGKNAADLPGKSGRLTLHVFNLSGRTKNGRIAVKGGTLTGLPERVEIPPFASVSFEAEYTPAYSDGAFESALEFGGVFDGREITRLTVPLICSSRLAEVGVELEIPTDPARWRSNAGGAMTIGYDRAERAVEFKVRFEPQDGRWIYPELPLELPRESLAGAAGISYEICAVADKPGYDLSYLMAVTEDEAGRKNDVHLRTEPPAEKWGTRFVPLDGVALERVRTLRIGFNPKGAEVTYWIRNVKIVRRP